MLVLTGETSLKDLDGSSIKPTFVLDSVASISEILESTRTSFKMR